MKNKLKEDGSLFRDVRRIPVTSSGTLAKYVIAYFREGKYQYLHEESGLFLNGGFATIYNDREEAEPVLEAAMKNDNPATPAILPIEFLVREPRIVATPVVPFPEGRFLKRPFTTDGKFLYDGDRNVISEASDSKAAETITEVLNRDKGPD